MPAAKKAKIPTCAQILKELKSLGTEQTRKIYKRHGAADTVYGIKIGDMKPIQKRIKKDYKLALDLYDTGIPDVQYFAGLIADDEKMTKSDLNKWARNAQWPMVSSCAVAWTASGGPHGFEQGLKWIEAKTEKVRQTGWSTLSSHASITPDEEIDLAAYRKLLDRVARDIRQAPNGERDTMNMFVIAVGCFIAPLKDAALKAAKKIGRVEIDMGETECKVFDATEYIQKVEKMGRTGRKKKAAKC